jgi:hypothetical protein
MEQLGLQGGSKSQRAAKKIAEHNRMLNEMLLIEGYEENLQENMD